MVQKYPTNLLRPHYKNKEIYSECDLTELMESIKKHGILSPIVVNKDKTIIAGHRRFEAAKQLKLKEVPVEVRKFENKNQELIYLVSDNQYREKTNIDKIKEGKLLEEIEKEEAKKRLSIKKEDKVITLKKGKAVDLVGEKIGMSGKTYTKGKEVLSEIYNMEEKGEPEVAKILTNKANKSISGAHKLINKTPKQIKSEIKKEEKQKENKNYTYTQDIEKILSVMKICQERIERNLRSKTVTESFKKFMNGMIVMREQIASWLPKNFVECPKCKGTGKGKKGKCVWCLNGKTGMYRGM